MTEPARQSHHLHAHGGDWIENGVQTGSGLLDGKAAVIQVATLPLLILLFGVGITLFWQTL